MCLSDPQPSIRLQTANKLFNTTFGNVETPLNRKLEWLWL